MSDTAPMSGAPAARTARTLAVVFTLLSTAVAWATLHVAILWKSAYGAGLIIFVLGSAAEIVFLFVAILAAAFWVRDANPRGPAIAGLVLALLAPAAAAALGIYTGEIAYCQDSHGYSRCPR